MIKFTSLLIFIIVPLQSYLLAQTVSDIDGNIYNTVTLGEQVWMRSNLITSKLNDGTPIPYVKNSNSWINLSTPGYCWYNNNSSNEQIQGKLYNAYAVNTNKLCPTGWYVPSKEDFKELFEHLGGDSIAGGKLKTADTTYWKTPNEGATNESGFSLSSTGLRYNSDLNGEYKFKKESSILWTSTVNTKDDRFIDCIMARYESKKIYYSTRRKDFGINVRCLKDTNSSDIKVSNTDKLSFYPNPANQSIVLSNVFPNSVLEIINLNGESLYKEPLDNLILDISFLSEGIYVLVVISSEKTITQMLVKN